MRRWGDDQTDSTNDLDSSPPQKIRSNTTHIRNTLIDVVLAGTSMYQVVPDEWG